MHILFNTVRLFLCIVFSSIFLILPIQAESADSGQKFYINITLSKKAADKLSSIGEGITALVSYYGEPRKGAERHANDIGMIDLGNTEVKRAGKPGKVAISEDAIISNRLQWINGPVKVNLNLYSSRIKAEDNLLSCDFIDSDVNRLAAPIELHCTLIEEGIASALKP